MALTDENGGGIPATMLVGPTGLHRPLMEDNSLKYGL